MICELILYTGFLFGLSIDNDCILFQGLSIPHTMSHNGTFGSGWLNVVTRVKYMLFWNILVL